MDKTVHKLVKICPFCNGEGKLWYSEEFDGEKGSCIKTYTPLKTSTVTDPKEINVALTDTQEPFGCPFDEMGDIY